MLTAFDNISLPSELENQDKIYIRITACSDNTINGGQLSTEPTGGEAAIDDIVLNGGPIEETLTADEEYIPGTPYRLEKADDSEYKELVYDNQVKHVIINQLYGNDSTKQPNPVSHSFIELYNPTDSDVSLKGWALHYKSSKEGKYSYYWEQYHFADDAVIKAHSSYLVRCNALGDNTDGTSQYKIEDADADWNIKLCNKGGAVVLTDNTVTLPVDSKVYDNKKKCPVIDGYVDMLAISGNDGTDTEKAPAYEGSVSMEQSKKKAIRRTGFADSDDNSVGADCEIIDYSYENADYIEWAAPRHSGACSWTATDCPKYAVTFVRNDGSGTEETKSFTMNTKPVVIEEPTWEGHTFMGWYVTSDCEVEFDFDSKPTGDVTIYAGWKMTNVPNAPSVTMSVDNETKKVSEVELPANWVWDETQVNLTIPAGGEISAQAEYVGEDRENYYNLTETVTVSRAECTPGEVIYSREGEIPPTCIETGLGHKECTICGDIVEEGVVTEALEHTGGVATCHTKAVCTRCEQPYGEFDLTNHDGETELRNAKEAKCEKEGYTGDAYCKGCDVKLTEGSAIEALGHEGGTATCHTKAVCTRCEKPYGEFDATNHDGGTELRNKREADYGVAGYTGDTCCKGCDTKISSGKETAALVPQEKPEKKPQDNTEQKNEQPDDGEKQKPLDTTTSNVKIGDKLVCGNATFKVTAINASGKNTVEYAGFAGKTTPATVKIPDEVTIEGTTYKVTSVGKNAFKGNKKLKKVIIGDNVAVIGNYAFYKASALKTVQAGKGLVKIGKHAFSYDKKLSKITIKSAKLKTVKSSAFKGTKNVKIKVNKKQLKKYRKLFKKNRVKVVK